MEVEDARMRDQQAQIERERQERQQQQQQEVGRVRHLRNLLYWLFCCCGLSKGHIVGFQRDFISKLCYLGHISSLIYE